MKIFQCQKCGSRLFFENSTCLRCSSELGFLAGPRTLTVIEPIATGYWQALAPEGGHELYKKCENYTCAKTCNWMVPVRDASDFCLACRLNRTIPDLNVGDNHILWAKLEHAKRRLIYDLLRLRLKIVPKTVDPERGLAFDFLADVESDFPQRILTGHEDGVITINLAEADDATREATRLRLREIYRTLLGHFRHESGHYYWHVLLRDQPGIERVRALFGDDRANYADALRNYYANGPRSDWEESFVTPYASAHPWEDWAETWAHYLHIIDTLETAAASGLILRDPVVTRVFQDPGGRSFASLIQDWHELRIVLNNLNRSMGMPDAYPFVVFGGTLTKLEFIHEWIATVAEGNASR